MLDRGGYGARAECGVDGCSPPRFEGMSGFPIVVPVATISPENPSEAIRTILAIIVEHAGGDFVGIQDALPEYGLPAYVLFNHPRHRSTLAVRLDKNFGTDAILRRLAECDQRFAGNG